MPKRGGGVVRLLLLLEMWVGVEGGGRLGGRRVRGRARR